MRRARRPAHTAATWRQSPAIRVPAAARRQPNDPAGPRVPLRRCPGPIPERLPAVGVRRAPAGTHQAQRLRDAVPGSRGRPRDGVAGTAPANDPSGRQQLQADLRRHVPAGSRPRRSRRAIHDVSLREDSHDDVARLRAPLDLRRRPCRASRRGDDTALPALRARPVRDRHSIPPRLLVVIPE